MRLRAVALWISLGISLAWVGGCGGAQPLPQCTIGRGQHAVRYTLVSGTGSCATKQGEIIGAQVFGVPGSIPTLSLEPHTLTALKGLDTSTSHLPYSSGAFTTVYPGSDGFCTVPSTSVAEQAVPVSTTSPAQDVQYQWSNIRVYSSTAIPGTQWTADLTYSEVGCTATYKAVGVFPATSCAVPNSQPVATDQSLCSAVHAGLSLDPAFPVTCDPATALCMLAGDPPVLNAPSK